MEYSSLKLEKMLASNKNESCLSAINIYKDLALEYESVLDEVVTKLTIINRDIAHNHSGIRRDIIQQIKSRIKTMESLVNKLNRLELNFSSNIVKKEIFDFAGIRVICSYVDDIYWLLETLTRQEDITIVEVKDYIKNPKKNGYKSLHVILEVPVYFAEKTNYLKIEVQFRTLAMDFWASLEHGIKYKRHTNDSKLSQRLLKVSETISEMEEEMLLIRKEIEEEATH